MTEPKPKERKSDFYILIQRGARTFGFGLQYVELAILVLSFLLILYIVCRSVG